MDAFSTQYMLSGKGLVRAMPVIQRALKLSDRLVTALAFVTALFTVLFAQLATRALPLVWPRYPELLPLVIGLVITGLILLFVILPWGRRRMARRFDQLWPPATARLAVDVDGVTVSDGLSHSHWAWVHVHGAVATPDGVVLLMGYSGMFVPANAFRDAAEQAALVELVNSRANRTGV